MSRPWRRLGPIYSLLVALQFLTRLPVPRDLNPDEQALGRSAVWFPTVGAIIGGMLGGMALAMQRWTPFGEYQQIAAVLIMGVLLTGAFHEDGLADTADGLWGGWRREDVLRIMRDSRVGTYGAAALVLAIVARCLALCALQIQWWPLALVVAHTVGRVSSLWLMLGLPYARETDAGQGKPLIEGLTAERAALGVASAAAICWWSMHLVGVSVLGIAAAMTLITGLYYRHRLHGITGDCLGATNVICEISALLWISSLYRRWVDDVVDSTWRDHRWGRFRSLPRVDRLGLGRSSRDRAHTGCICSWMAWPPHAVLLGSSPSAPHSRVDRTAHRATRGDGRGPRTSR